MKFVVCLKPSPFTEIDIFHRFCAPIECYAEFNNIDDADYCITNTNWDELKGTGWEAQRMNKPLFLKLVKLQKKAIEKERLKRIKYIQETRIKLANCSASAYRMQQIAKGSYNYGRHYSHTPLFN